MDLFYIPNINTDDEIVNFPEDEKKHIMILDEESIHSEHPVGSYCGWELINVPDMKVY